MGQNGAFFGRPLGCCELRLALLRAPLPGWRMRLAHKAGSMLDHGPYSHGELVFSDHITGSSWADTGVSLRDMPGRYEPDIWNYWTLPDELEADSRRWFADNQGALYDPFGCVRFAIGVVRQTADRWYCHEAIAESLGLRDSWRFTGGLFVSQGPRLWPGEFKRVPAPWYTPLPVEILRCSRD